MKNRLEELLDQIDTADEAYYNKGSSKLEDARYDKLRKELQELDPSNPRLIRVGAEVRDSILQKKKHSIQMSSLNKALTRSELDSYIKNTWYKNGISEGELLHASLKMDGGSVSLEYKDGRLVSAITRGDGLVGEDITANALKFKNLPRVIVHNKNQTVCDPFTGFVRGEIVLENDDWKEVDPEQSTNPRNLAVGIARRKDGTQSELIKFYAFSLSVLQTTEAEVLGQLEYFGFDIPPNTTGTVEEVWKWYLDQQKFRNTLPYWIDGVVVKINDIKKQQALGESGGCPKGQVAIKFDAEGAETILRGVTLQVGQTGAIVPVANFDSVRLGGATVSNANLCNWENIRNLDIAINDTIRVIKAGDIIPRIMEVLAQPIKRICISLPTKCPVCFGKIGYKSNVSGEESTAIYCLNEHCPAVVIGKIQKYITSLDIQGIGDGVIKSLVDQNILKKPSDLYLLDENIAHVDISGKVRLGEKRAEKILTAIRNKKELTLPEFLGSLGIFGLGKRRVQLIMDALPEEFETLEDWISSDKLLKHAENAGIPNIGARIYEELVNQKENILQYIENGVTIKKKEIKQHKNMEKQYSICITGTLDLPREEYQQMIEDAGHIFATAITKSVTHLCVADPTKVTTKTSKAQKLGIPIIDAEELLKLIGH